MAIVLATGALGEVIETEATFQSIGGGKGGQARSFCDILGLWTGDGDDDGRGRCPFATFVGGEPSGFLREDEACIESGELYSDVEESVGGRDAVDNELCHRHVQVDRGGTRDEVEKGRGPRV